MVLVIVGIDERERLSLEKIKSDYSNQMCKHKGSFGNVTDRKKCTFNKTIKMKTFREMEEPQALDARSPQHGHCPPPVA